MHANTQIHSVNNMSKNYFRNSLHFYVWGSVVFFSISLLVLYIQQANFHYAVARGLLIPDVVNMTQRIDMANDDMAEIGDIFGVYILYISTWSLHPAFSYLINAILIGCTIFIHYLLAIKVLGVSRWYFLAFFNPYLFLAMPGPNKEIPLLLITIYCVYVVLSANKNFILTMIAFFLAFIAYYLRDGYGIFLLLTLSLFTFLKSDKVRRYSLLILFIPIVSIAYPVLAEFIPIFERNSNSANEISNLNLAVGSIYSALGLDELNPFSALMGFFIRVFYNLMTQALFPVFFTSDGGINWLGVCYWINGILIIIFFPSCIRVFFSRNEFEKNIKILSGICIGTLFLISISLYVQPRYLMPVIPIASLVNASLYKGLRIRYIFFGLIIVFIIYIAYDLLGVNRVPSEVQEFNYPAYIYFKE
jgi:hypothetical protein